MIRYVIYAQYSSDLQSPAPLEDQKRKCWEYANREGWIEVRTYEDAAMSGTGMDRLGFQRLIADSASLTRDFEVILIDDISRLSTSLADVVTQHQRPAHFGVRVIAVSQGINTNHEHSELLIAMHGITDSLYVKELGKKTHRGLEGKFLKGLSAGGNCYGYDTEPVQSGGVRWIINNAESRVVEKIFEWSAADCSLKAIAGFLKDRRTRRRKKRSDPLPYAMLRRELYRYANRNRTKFVKTPGTNKRIARPRPRSEWQVQDVLELRIISDDLWSRVQKRQNCLKEVYAESVRKSADDGYRGCRSERRDSAIDGCRSGNHEDAPDSAENRG
jgi:site-specific DNA recombinase